MKPLTLFKYIAFQAVAGALLASSIMCAEKPNTYSNKEFGFSFQYPASWTVSPSPMPNLRARVVAPANGPAAECAVVVKRYPKAATAKQSDIDQIFMESPTAAELEEVLSQGGEAVKVAAASSGRLQSRPAHFARFRFRKGGDAYVSGQAALTATPGLTWSVACSAQGNDPAKADKNFQYWQSSVNALMGSFQFK